MGNPVAPGPVPLGTPILEADQGSLISSTWQRFFTVLQAWVVGLEVAPSSGNAANLPSGLGAADSGLLYYASDYGHTLEWMGSGWTWAPGELGSGFIVAFASGITPVPPTGWHVCDGSTVTMLNSDGTTVNVTLPSTPGSWFRQ
jgi:hypothetical protein